MQLDMLWNFMQYDMEADKFEAEMRQAPNRLKLLKQRDFLIEQQNNIKKIENEVSAMYDRMEAVRDEADRLAGVLKNLLDTLEETPPETIEDIQKQVGAAQKLENTLYRYEQELSKMRKDSDTRDRQQKEIRLRAARTKSEFDKLKQEYDVEFKKDSAQLTALKKRAEEECKQIDGIMLERYRAIKQHVTPAMAQLNGDRCGGCNMALPAAMLSEIRSGSKIVECDNCGRILFIASND